MGILINKFCIEMILFILLLTIFNESILEPTIMSFKIVQFKTYVTCSVPSFTFIFRSLYYAKTADTGMQL